MKIYKFRHNNENIVLDINSSTIFKVDDAMFEVLDKYPSINEEQLMGTLGKKIGKTLLKEAIEEIDELIGKGLLFSNKLVVEQNAQLSKYVKALCLNVSFECNLACNYCFVYASENKPKGLMDYQTACDAIDFLIANSGQAYNLEVDFFGGEPTLNFEVMAKTIEYAKSKEKNASKKFRFTTTTNAVGLDGPMIDFINDEMYNVVFSLDGRPSVNDSMRGKGSYDSALEGIRKTIEKRGNKSYYVRGTYTSQNLDFASDVMHLADLGITNISVEPVATSDPRLEIKEEHLEVIFNEYNKLAELYLECVGTERQFSFFHFNLDTDNATCIYKRLSGCGVGSSYYSVDPDGSIYPCHQFAKDPVYLMGNVSLPERFNEQLREGFRAMDIPSSSPCNECWAKYHCGGGCRANAYNLNNDISAPYKIGCELLKKRLECALYIKCRQKTLNV
ncbi:MAG: thioether cross-link-forming SCIFF peptide maturase [Eubacteriaceae bacterium]|nr:thioether cross-link-forming SCIFF peptide maturase [Eubacteriaceae bacterium]